MEYRTARLRQLNQSYSNLGGLEGAYRYMRDQGWTRKMIAAQFGMGVPALALWVTKWNKEAAGCTATTADDTPNP